MWENGHEVVVHCFGNGDDHTRSVERGQDDQYSAPGEKFAPSCAPFGMLRASVRVATSEPPMSERNDLWNAGGTRSVADDARIQAAFIPGLFERNFRVFFMRKQRMQAWNMGDPQRQFLVKQSYYDMWEWSGCNDFAALCLLQKFDVNIGGVLRRRQKDLSSIRIAFWRTT